MTDENRHLKVFLCHASPDKPQVFELYKRLAAEGWIDPWLDVENLLPGQYWSSAIEQALTEADSIIIFISHNSVDREGFVQREMNLAWNLSLQKPRNVIYLIPVRLEDCDVPFELCGRQWTDYFGEKQEETYQALLRSFKLRIEQKLRSEAKDGTRKENAQRAAEVKQAYENTKHESAGKVVQEQGIITNKIKEPHSHPTSIKSPRKRFILQGRTQLTKMLLGLVIFGVGITILWAGRTFVKLAPFALGYFIHAQTDTPEVESPMVSYTLTFTPIFSDSATPMITASRTKTPTKTLITPSRTSQIFPTKTATPTSTSKVIVISTPTNSTIPDDYATVIIENTTDRVVNVSFACKTPSGKNKYYYSWTVGKTRVRCVIPVLECDISTSNGWGTTLYVRSTQKVTITITKNGVKAVQIQ
jgi:hypothetical protein